MSAANASNFQLIRNPFGRLVFTGADGEAHEGVVPVRAFPIGAPEEGIALVNTEGHELLWIDRMEDLPENAVTLVQEELASREFVPEIKRIRSVSSFACPSTWEIDTDRGDARLVLKGEEDIRRLGSRSKLMIASEEGIHFLVPDVAALDKPSRKLLERFL